MVQCGMNDAQEAKSGREVLADRTHHFNAPVSVLFSALSAELERWIQLSPGEVNPVVIESVPLTRVVWSSFWPASPEDTIELDLAGDGDEKTTIRLRWFTNDPPDARGIGITRQRLNEKIGGDLRSIVSEYYWTHEPD